MKWKRKRDRPSPEASPVSKSRLRNDYSLSVAEPQAFEIPRACHGTRWG
jgi:hypothetical protein